MKNNNSSREQIEREILVGSRINNWRFSEEIKSKIVYKIYLQQIIYNSANYTHSLFTVQLIDN